MLVALRILVRKLYYPHQYPIANVVNLNLPFRYSYPIASTKCNLPMVMVRRIDSWRCRFEIYRSPASISSLSPISDWGAYRIGRGTDPYFHYRPDLMRRRVKMASITSAWRLT